MATILILDPDNDVRRMIAATLEHEGHKAIEAGRVEEADEHIRKQLPSIIMMELALEGEDGLQYMKDLLGDGKLDGIPVIVVSTLRRKKIIVEGLNAGATDYITKPFDPREPKVRVDSALKINELKKVIAQNQQLQAMRETAKTVQYEIEMPMREIQRHLIQLRNEKEDFTAKDSQLLEEAWKHFSHLEDILLEAQKTQ